MKLSLAATLLQYCWNDLYCVYGIDIILLLVVLRLLINIFLSKKRYTFQFYKRYTLLPFLLIRHYLMLPHYTRITLNGAQREKESMRSSILLKKKEIVKSIIPITLSTSDDLWFQEFLRRHGSTSKLCRKVRSADNLPLASTNPRRNSKDDSTEGDRESFLKPNQDDKSEDQDSRRQSSLESATKDNTETSLLDPSHQQPSSR